MIRLSCNSRGYIQQRESQSLEFKQTFRLGDSLIEYAKTLVGMANNQGGDLVFGVKDKPRIPIGLAGYLFDDFDARELNKVLLEYFSHDIAWSRDVFEIQGVRLGVLHVEEASDKPIICSKNHEAKKLREGAIYFRYRGETREIRYTELKMMLQKEREKERDLWMNHLQAIARIGPRYTQVVDGSTGEIRVGDAKVVLEESLLDKLKLVKEGRFNGRDGAPALRLVGDIEGVLAKDHVAYTETAYPYTQSTMLEELPLNTYDFQALVWQLKLKGNPRYHAEIKTGRKGSVQKYSVKALSRIKEVLRCNENAIAEARAAYRTRNRGSATKSPEGKTTELTTGGIKI